MKLIIYHGIDISYIISIYIFIELFMNLEIYNDDGYQQLLLSNRYTS